MKAVLPWVVLLGCADLPAGWEGAARIADLTQSECEGSPYDEGFVEAAEASVVNGAVEVVMQPVAFRCAQDVEGFALDDGVALKVLVQPVVMRPRIVAGCDCAYRVEMTVLSAAGTVEAWKRWDALNEPNDPMLVAAIQLDGS